MIWSLSGRRLCLAGAGIHFHQVEIVLLWELPSSNSKGIIIMLNIIYGCCKKPDLSLFKSDFLDYHVIDDANDRCLFAALSDESHCCSSSYYQCFAHHIVHSKSKKVMNLNLSKRSMKSHYRHNSNLICTLDNWAQFYSKRDVLRKAKNRLQLPQ